MAKIARGISAKRDGNGRSEVMLRVTVDRMTQIRLRSGIFVPANRFKDGVITMPRANQKEVQELRAIEDRLIALERHLIALCENQPKVVLTKAFLSEEVERYNHPERFGSCGSPEFFDVFARFADNRELSECRRKYYGSLGRALRRFDRIVKGGTMSVDSFSANDAAAFDHFLRTEHVTWEDHPEVYMEFPADSCTTRNVRKPRPRGNNAIVSLFNGLRAFFNWCNAQGITDNRPFLRYSGATVERYGTPYYLTMEERDRIAEWDLSGNPGLEVQRDIFVFHCFIGCRVSDLMRLVPANIIAGGVEYIATKTHRDRPEVIRVPLHHRAAAIVEKYSGMEDGRLLPFISAQKYNEAIKRIFTVCGVTRPVTVLNPTTGREEQRPLNEIASSHIARRTFIGNLYKQVKDPNLVGKLSGHKEGSKAFARYRDIDEDMKRDLISLLGE